MRANAKNETFFQNLVKVGTLIIRDDGTIQNAVTLKIYNRKAKKGHIQVTAKFHGVVRHILAHRLVYLVKIGPLDPNDHVVHLDGCKSNNRPINLAKMDSSETTMHSRALHPDYQKNVTAALRDHYDLNLIHNAKLSHIQVIEMRNRFAAGESTYRLAKEFKMERKDVAKIVRGQAYRSVKPATLDQQP